MDTRNSYRMVSVKNRAYWKVQFRRWWSPFWEYFEIAEDKNEATEAARQHSMPVQVVNLGKFPVLP